jgi:predicted nucleotidyltransferase
MIFKAVETMNDQAHKSIKEVLNQLDYDRIILFGSRARDDFSERSDYDILVVLHKSITIEEKMKILANLRNQLAHKGIDADIILKSTEEVEYYKDKIGSVVKTALNEGVVI